MPIVGTKFPWGLLLVVLIVVLSGAGKSLCEGAPPAGAAGALPPLEPADISWLWPVPETVADLGRIHTIDSLAANGGQPVWSDANFAEFIQTAKASAKVGSNAADIPSEFETRANWRIVSFRVDPSAPGGHADVRAKLGETPQIRLILQPVTTSGQEVVVHDVAAHVVFSFLKGGPTPEPDRDAFGKVIEDLRKLKQLCEEGGAPTKGLPLGIHPGLAKPVAGLDAAVAKFLKTHLSADRLTALAIMGIDGPEPWIFLAMAKFPPGATKFGPVAFLPAQMLTMRTNPPSVVPQPVVTNRLPISAQRVQLSIPDVERRGVATAILFKPGLDLNAAAVVGSGPGGPLTDPQLKVRDIADLIANPEKAHFFNTDCVSCHTETRRRMRLGLATGQFAYRVNGKVPEVAQAVLPKDDWNVRNFGWFPPHPFLGGGPAVATVTQRTANETAEAAKALAELYPGR
jgi:hypothetical protein